MQYDFLLESSLFLFCCNTLRGFESLRSKKESTIAEEVLGEPNPNTASSKSGKAA